MISVGANFKLGYVLLTQRPSDVDTKAISRCGQLFIGKHFEVNDINKLRRFLGWRKFEDAYQRLPSLKRGEFYYCASTSTKITTPLHRQIDVPMECNDYLESLIPEKPKSWLARLLGA
jgi:DNA helicase HerA-like ATPase